MGRLTLFMGRCWVVLRVLVLLSFCSCQAPIRTCKPMVPVAPERESGATFVARRTGPEIRLQSGGSPDRGGLMVGRDGMVHLFWAIRGDGLLYWRYEGGKWVSLGQVTDLEWDRVSWYGPDRLDVVETPDGRLYLFLMDKVLSRVGEGWEVVHTLNDFYYPILARVRAVVGPDGVVHVFYSGNLGEVYMHIPDSSRPSKLFHAMLRDGRWTRGRPTARRGRYDPEDFEAAIGPEGSLYVAFRMDRVLPFLGPPPGWKYQPPDLALSVFEDGNWQEPVILVEAPDEASGIPARPFGWVRAPGIVVDRAGTCHVVMNNNYLQYRNGECTTPWPFSSHAYYGSTIFLDRQQRLIIFFLKDEGLVARIRDHRGWSETSKVTDSTEARPLQGFDGHIYLGWSEGRPADLCLQRIAFDEVSAATAPAQ